MKKEKYIYVLMALMVLILIICYKKQGIQQEFEIKNNKNMYSYVEDGYEMNFFHAYDFIEANVDVKNNESKSCEFSVDGNNKQKVDVTNNNCNYTFLNLEEGKKYNIEINFINEQNEIIKSINKEVSTITNLAEHVKSLKNWNGNTAEVYYHDSHLTLGAKDNSYRYAGKSEDINNYVCFGSDEEKCPIDNLYRIIGAFDEDKDEKYNVKLITSDYINEEILGSNGNRNTLGDFETHSNYIGEKENIDAYFWINQNNTINNWEDSDLNKINLNTNFIGKYKIWENLIAYNKWHINGVKDNIKEYTAVNVFENEVNNEKYYSDEIGLMYISDYLYSISPAHWGKNIQEYSNYKNDSWMYLGANEWTISKNIDKSNDVFYIGESGKISSYNGSKMFYAIRPNLYLKDGVGFIEGDGSKNNPYYIINTTPILGNIGETHTDSKKNILF